MPGRRTSRLSASPPRLRPSAPVLEPSPKVADELYTSSEYRIWREEVMRRGGWRCCVSGCGRGRLDGRLYADHIVEVKDGGERFDPANGQVMCASCHVKKGAVERRKRMQSVF